MVFVLRAAWDWGAASRLLFLGMAVLLAACATAPKPPQVPEVERFLGFPPGALGYLYVDTVKARPILEVVLQDLMRGNPKTMAAALDKTTKATAALYPKGAPQRFLVAAQGRYPRFGASLSFTFSSAWKKRHAISGPSYWYSLRQGIGVRLETDRAIISDGEPLLLGESVVPQVPEAFASFAEEAALSGWLTEGAMPLNQLLQTLGIPLQIPTGQVVFRLESWETGYQGLIRLETPSVSQAKALASLFSLAGLFIGKQDLQGWGSILFAHPPVQDGAVVTLQTGLLEPKELALLFSTFSVYSN